MNPFPETHALRSATRPGADGPGHAARRALGAEDMIGMGYFPDEVFLAAPGDRRPEPRGAGDR